MFKPGDTVFWLDLHGSVCRTGLVVAIDGLSRIATIDTGKPMQTGWAFVGVCDLFRTASDAEASRPGAPWDDQRAAGELLAWLKTFVGGGVKGAYCTGGFVVHLERGDTVHHKAKRSTGTGKTWAEAVGQAITRWNQKEGA